MDAALLGKCMGCSSVRAELFILPLNYALTEYDINTPARLAAFLAQTGHETGSLAWMAEIWGPTDAQKRYEGRADLGNTQPGDGERFKGRGWIQITGRANYQAASNALCVDFVSRPELLESADFAPVSASWWWESHGLNQLADANDAEHFTRITRVINGGVNGLADRMTRWANCKKLLGVP